MPRAKAPPKARGKATAAARSMANKADHFNGVVDEATPSLDCWPADPEDPRLSLKGAKFDDDGKIDISAYEDLFKHFSSSEPSPENHPDPTRPGVRMREHVPKGLRVWDDLRAGATDKDGAGWIALRSATKVVPKREKWFNIKTCGSWRLAFLLAKLQKEAWELHKVSVTASKRPLPSDSLEKGEATSSADVSAMPGVAAQQAEPKHEGTPPAKRQRVKAAGEKAEEKTSSSSKKAAKPKAKGAAGGEDPVGGKADEKQANEPVKPASKLITSEVCASSKRLQEILAARQLQASAGNAKAA